MNRILEFTPSQEEAVVARVLVLVHQAVDEHFPAVAQANRQFTKTVFSGEGESTSIVRAPLDENTGGSGQFGASEDTSPVGRPTSDAHVVPPPPASVPPPPRQGVRPAISSSPAAGTGARESSRPQASLSAELNPMGEPSGEPTGTKSTRLDQTIDGLKVKPPVDWFTRLTLAAFVAGVVLLIYALFS
jgi:hypothetical protein